MKKDIKIKIDLSTLSKELIILVITHKEKRYTKRIIKQ